MDEKKRYHDDDDDDDDDDDVFCTPYLPCKFEKKFQFLKKILKRIKNFWMIKLCKKNSIRCHFLLGISCRNCF